MTESQVSQLEFILFSITIVNSLILMANVGIVAASLKVWTEIVKAENMKRIGKP